jgi:KUP system potassium uptake protein
MRERMDEGALPVELFIRSTISSVARVPGTAVFLSSASDGVPSALLHNIKHNKVLHERVLILTVAVQQVPHIAEAERIELQELGDSFYRVTLRYGFMEEVDIPADLMKLQRCGAQFRMMDTSFFLGRQKLIASPRPGMAIWRENLFAWMTRNSESAMQFFKLPPNRVIELGSQVEI